MRKKYEDFKPNLPLIYDLRNPSFQKRHWNQINKIIREFNSKLQEGEKRMVEFEEDLNVSYKELLSCGLMNFKEDLQNISETASKEKGIERIMNKMRTDWKPIKLDIIPYKDTETYILRGVDIIMD